MRVSRIIYGMGTLKAMRAKRNVIIQTRHELVKCKYCGETDDIIRHGHGKGGLPRYRCRRCGRTFMNNQASGRMQYPIEAVATALNLFYEGISLPKIQRQLKMTYGIGPQPSTIYYWIVRYSKKAANALSNVSIKPGTVWVADETVIKLKERGGLNQWFWDIIDDKTRFLLASHMSDTRTTRDARTLMERAAARADKIPKTITTDKLAAYLDGIELAFGADTKHIQAKKLAVEDGTQLIERFHGTLKDRTKVMRAMMTKKTAGILTDGWLVHYNFFRPHGALGGKTPAEEAGADAPYKSWRDVVEKE